MDYQIWVDSESKIHFIHEMDDTYIRNCIASIKHASKRIDLDDPSIKADTFNVHVLDYNWCILHAKGYLKEFNKELSERRTIRYEF